MNKSDYPVVIIGGGSAGLYAALKLVEDSTKISQVLLVTKSELGECNSRHAQGGIVGVLKSNKNDTVALHVEDTIVAGAGLSDYEAVEKISKESDEAIQGLIKEGVEFDRDSNGELKLTLEGAHHVKRILHAGGDATGKHIEEALKKRVVENDKIKVLENTMAVELLVNNAIECVGAIVLQNGAYKTIYSPNIILATGGLGQLYKHTTNPKGATADGIALAYRAGAVVQDMEFVQFHPTALAINNGVNNFLISEAVRGEGAKLVHKNGERFMNKYHEMKELAPRDIVTRANFNEMQEHGVKNVYLDATVIGEDELKIHFPSISKECLKNGIDIAKDYIPVFPAAHYFMGGIKSEICGRTSIKGLWAIGETSATGLHGANRLASNSLLECIVMANELAKTLIKENIQDEVETDEKTLVIENLYKTRCEKSKNTDELKTQLKDIMWEYVGILRDKEGLNKGLEKISEISKIFDKILYFDSNEYELRNMLTCCELIAQSALKREESRGAHFRTDFQERDEVAKHSYIKKGKEKGEPCFVE